MTSFKGTPPENVFFFLTNIVFLLSVIVGKGRKDLIFLYNISANIQ